MEQTITIRSRDERISPNTFFGVFDVPETASQYRVLVYRHAAAAGAPAVVAVSILNWETSCEFGSLPTSPGMAHSLAEHLTKGNMVDATNMIGVLQKVDAAWRAQDRG